MRIRGFHVIKRLLRGKNTVAMLGPVVIKRLGSPNARRKYDSETRARALLAQAGIDVVPIFFGVRSAGLIVMQRARRSTFDRELTDGGLRAFESHILELVEQQRQRLSAVLPAEYGWLGASANGERHPSFVDFLVAEFSARQQVFADSFPAFAVGDVLGLLKAAQPFPERLVVLTDVAPKNMVYSDGRFAHLDLEVTLIGPPEFLLVKAAVNLTTDVGDRLGARAIRRNLLAQCASLENARASLAFSLVRRLLYERDAGRTDPRAGVALRALLDGAALDDAIATLEGNWGSALELNAQWSRLRQPK